MFMFHTALYLGILALISGLSLYIWALRNQGEGTKLAKVFGIIIVIVTLFSFLCMSYYAITSWHKPPMGMRMMHGKPMGSMESPSNSMPQGH